MRSAASLSSWLLTSGAVLFAFCFLVTTVNGHGRLIEPPSRATAWRYGFDTPPNYNDHELFCGGYSRQWSRNAGKCGECGDAWDLPRPRPHELGGKWGQGVVVRRYQENSTMLLRIELTASHNGYFIFRLCPDSVADQNCLDRYPLQLIGGEGEGSIRFYPRNGSRVYEMRAQLPPGLRCERCMLQWRYIAGNNWGDCPDGTGAVGCGPQEEFRACADISIGYGTSPSTIRPARPGAASSTEQSSSDGSSTTITPPVSDEKRDDYTLGIVIALIALLAVLACLALVYLYFYRGGMRIKSLLMKGKEKKCAASVQPDVTRSKVDVPSAPPRLKKAAREINDNDIDAALKNGDFA